MVGKRIEEVKTQGKVMYSSYFVLFFTGWYRLMPSMSFSIELGVGYAIEVFLCILPMAFCQTFNNMNAKGGLTALQSIAVILKCLTLLNFIVEFTLMILEIILNRRYRKLEIPGFEKKSEEERRRLHSKTFAILSTIALMAFTIVLLMCLLLAPMRHCGEGHSLQMAMCVNCEDDGCTSCDGNPSYCDTCIPGKYATSDGKCFDCD